MALLSYFILGSLQLCARGSIAIARVIALLIPAIAVPYILTGVTHLVLQSAIWGI
jgi:small neutral amino acid transporter SnatA (MarC family)